MSTSDGAKRTVLVLNHSARPRHIAAGTRHVELFSRLDGWDARIIVGDRGLKGADWRGRDGAVESVRTVPFATNGVARVLNWMSYALGAFVRGIRTRPLHLVYGSSPHLLAALAGFVIARARRVPFVLEIRDVWPRVLVDMGTLRPTSPIYRLLEALEVFLYRRADRIVILAAGVSNHLAAHGIDAAKIVFIPNAADAVDFEVAESRQVLRERYGLSGVVAVYAGSHGPANGLDLVLDAAKELEHRVPNVHVLFAGDGVDKERLMARADSEGIRRVRFMDPIPKDQMPELLAAADIGVHCLADVALFRDSVSPNKLFDYMAAGLPVVTNTPGEVASYVEESGGGLATQPDDLASALERLASISAPERRQMGLCGQEYLTSTRSRSAMARRLEELLNSVVA